MKTSSKQKRLLIIDGNHYLNRAFYATKGLKSKKGVATNAIRGFLNILISDIYKLRPSHILVTFDKKAKKGKKPWRVQVYPQYKANRSSVFNKTDKKSLQKQAEILSMREQSQLLKDFIRAMGIRILNKSGVEADDLMGTIAVEYAAKGYDVLIGTGDKDIMQIVGGNIRLTSPDRELIDQIAVIKRFGVKPDQIVDYLTICGDSADNIAGVKGMGAAAAKEVLGRFGTLSKTIKNIQKLKPGMQKALASAEPDIPAMRKIITLRTDEPHKVKTSQLVFPNESYDKDWLKELCAEYDMKTTYKQITDGFKAWTRSTKKSTDSDSRERRW